MQPIHRLSVIHMVFAIPLAASALTACDGSLADPLMNAPLQVTPGQSGRITNTVETSGAVLSQVNAADAMSWVYVQLGSGTEVMPQDPQSSRDWDLAFQRYQIKVNGGVSGTGGVEVALLTGTPFASLMSAPAAGYVTDQADSGDDGPEPDYAFVQRGTWYDYNVMTHLLTPKDQLYVLRAASGAYYKLQLTAYYDQAGSSGYPTIRWQTVQAP